MYIWCKDSSYRAYKHAKIGQFDYPSLRLHIGRNMTTACQIMLRHHTAAFDITGVTVTGELDGVTVEQFYQDFAYFDDQFPYPDQLCRKATVHVERNVTQGIYLTLAVGDAEVGNRKITCTVHTSEGDYTATIFLVIHKATLPEPKDGVLQHEYWTDFFKNLKGMEALCEAPSTPFYDFEAYSPEWWNLQKHFIEYHRSLRINTLLVPLRRLWQDAGSKRISETKWHFDFSKVDEFMEFYLKHGSYSRLAISHIIKPFLMRTVEMMDETGNYVEVDIEKPEAETWLRAYYTAIYEHFSEKGWISMLHMHVKDEPHDTDAWLWGRKILRECMPGVIAAEPIDRANVGPVLDTECDIHIPRFDIYEIDRTYYQKFKEQGKTLWCYSCCFPEEPWWLNRFLDLPQHYVAMIYWACFSQGFTGYLHWALCCWETGDDLFSGKTAQFKGDPYLIYPDVENKSVVPTVRALTTAEGVQDYELLTMLAKYDEATAKQISARVARSFRDFNEDPQMLSASREEALTLLDGWMA